MKTKSTLLVVALLLGFLSMSGVANAQNPGVYVKEANTFLSNRGSKSELKMYNKVSPTSHIGTLQKSEAEEVTVNITLVYDNGEYYPEHMFFHDPVDPNKGAWVEFPEDGSKTFSVRVPKGSYWVNIIYSPVAPATPQIHIIKEDLNIDSETSLTFDTADAVNRITFKAKLPNGEFAKSDMTNMDGDIVEQGNVYKDNTIQTTIYKEPTGWFAAIWGGGGRSDHDGSILDFDDCFDILINTLSHKFSCSCVKIFTSHEGNVIVTDMGAYLDQSITVSNDPSDYRFVENKFIPSSNNDPDKPALYDYGVSYIYGYNQIFNGQMTSFNDDITTPNCYIGLSDLNKYTNGTTSVVTLNYAELLDFNDFDETKSILSAPYTNLGNQYPVYNYSGKGYFSGIFIADSSSCARGFNPFYSHTATPGTQTFGNSVPFVSFYPMITYSSGTASWFVPNFNFSFIGMNGEQREPDLYAAKLDVKLDGKTVFDNMTAVNGWCWGWFADGANRGVYDISVIDENMKVDNMQGRNETEIHFDLANESDYLPPLLTWMQYRDKDDYVTNSIGEKSGARLLFSAGDFDFHNNVEGHMWFTCRETQPTVKVEYAPHGSGEFTELTVVERPEDFFMPGFGFQYEVALDQVARKAYGGWFDLRVSLADAAGNSQSQLMSPAFKLEDQSGVESVRDMVEAVRVEGRDIIAPEGAAIYGTDGLRTDGKGVQPGIYIVRHGDRALKIRVR